MNLQISTPPDWIRAIDGYDRLIQSYDATGFTRMTLGETLLGTPIYAYQTEGDGGTGVPVLISAGAHAEEVAGVISALEVAQSPMYTGPIVIVPCRDPLGWDGVRRTFRRLVGAPDLPLSDHKEVVEAFADHGRILWDEDGFVVAMVDELAFCSFDPAHPGNADTGEFVQHYLRETDPLAEALRGTRLIVPGSPGLAEGRDVYDWGGGPTVYVDDTGRVGNFNRFFTSEDPPIEVEVVRRLAERLGAEFAFDLHENFGDKFGMYTNAHAPGKARRVYVPMVDAVRAAGYPLMPLDELLPFLDVPPGALEELYPGVFCSTNKRLRRGDGLGRFLTGLGTTSFTTEMGLGRPLAVRSGATLTALRAGLRAIDGSGGTV